MVRCTWYASLTATPQAMCLHVPRYCGLRRYIHVLGTPQHNTMLHHITMSPIECTPTQVTKTRQARLVVNMVLESPSAGQKCRPEVQATPPSPEPLQSARASPTSIAATDENMASRYIYSHKYAPLYPFVAFMRSPLGPFHHDPCVLLGPLYHDPCMLVRPLCQILACSFIPVTPRPSKGRASRVPMLAATWPFPVGARAATCSCPAATHSWTWPCPVAPCAASPPASAAPPCRRGAPRGSRPAC